jgi:hypothetical protein
MFSRTSHTGSRRRLNGLASGVMDEAGKHELHDQRSIYGRCQSRSLVSWRHPTWCAVPARTATAAAKRRPITADAVFRSPRRLPRLGGLFDVARCCARIAVRRGRHARLVAAGPAAGRRPLRPTATNAGGGGVLKLLTHAIELCRVLGAEPAAGFSRMRTMTSTTTTHI